MRLTALGVALGLATALALSRPLGRLLYGVQQGIAWNPHAVVLMGAAVFGLGIGFLASRIPARRATLTDLLTMLTND